MVTCRTKALRRFGTLAVAVIVAVASLMLGAAPASAAGDIRYENVGNPSWCLDGNGINGGTDAYLHRCGSDFQVWTVGDSGNMVVKQKVSGKCLQSQQNFLVVLGTCGALGTLWYVTGKNGWVKFIAYELFSRGMCLQPSRTEVGGQSTYTLVVNSCHPRPDVDPKDLNNVPNIVAWRYFA